MKIKSSLTYINKLFDDFEVFFRKKNIDAARVKIGNETKTIAFLSIGNASIRAYVHKKIPQIS